MPTSSLCVGNAQVQILSEMSFKDSWIADAQDNLLASWQRKYEEVWFGQFPDAETEAQFGRTGYPLRARLLIG